MTVSSAAGMESSAVAAVDLLARVEACYDAIPRVGGARVERLGPFELFVRDGPGWPYYARPHIGAQVFAPADVVAVRQRQQSLGLPEAIEWVDQVSPGLVNAAQRAGMAVLEAPLLVLDPDALPTTWDSSASGGAHIEILDPDAPDFASLFAASSAVAQVGFGFPGTATGPDGPAQRDAAIHPAPAELIGYVADGIRHGHKAEAVARSDADGIVARAAMQAAGEGAEIVGVATLPSARRRGLGAALSAVLARHALEHGYRLIFVSAATEAVAGVYARIGFRRVGTACIAEPLTAKSAN